MQARGHLWQGRFYSCLLDESYLIAASKYIERNPVRARIVRKPWEWKWSSASAHINKKESPLRLGGLFKIIDISYDSWREYIDSEEDEKTLDNIRKHTLTGRPLGAITFIEKLEKIFNRRLIPLPRGRPKKRQK